MTNNYIKELEDLIGDELLPMYLVGCRAVGKPARTTEILKKLLVLKKLDKPIAALLRKPSTITSNLT
jgi:hypothetical protein